MIELYLKDMLVDLGDSTIAMTFRSSDIGSINARFSSFSNTIDLPKTPNNISIMDYLSVNGNTSTVPYTATTCRLILDGVEKISNGIAHVSESSNVYKLNIFDAIRGLSDILADKTLAELNWSNSTIDGIVGANLNHDLTYSTLVDSFDNTSGYIYTPNNYYCDFPNQFDTGFVDFMTPNLFLKTIWDEIFRQNKLTYTAPFFSSYDITKAVVGMNKGTDRINDPVTVIGSISFPPIVSNNYSPGVISVFYSLYSTTVTETNDYYFSISNLKTSIYNSVGGAYQNIFAWVFYIYIDGNIAIYQVIPNTGAETDEWSSFYNKTVRLFINSGSTFEIKIGVQLTGIGYKTVGYVFDTLLFSKTPHHVPIDFSNIIGDTKQIDFIKDTLIRYGLMIEPTTTYNDYKISSMKDVLTSKSTADDWSDIVTSDQEVESYVPSFGDTNNRINNFKYQYSLDTGVKNYDGQLIIDNVNISKEGDFYNSIYTIINNDYGILQPYFQPVFDDTFQPKESGLKISILDHVIETVSVKFKGNDYGSYNINGLIPNTYLSKVFSGSLVSIYGNDLITKFYSDIKLVLDKFKKVKFKGYLTPQKLNDLSSSRLIFIDRTSKYYYFNKINNYKSGQIADIELIELPA